MLAADTCFVRVLVVGCGLCDFFVLFVFCVFTPALSSAAFVVVVLLVVCSLFRAHGGCLGMLSR